MPAARAGRPDAYRFTIAAGVASLHGVYTGDIVLSDQTEPSSFVLTAAGAGGPGSVSISVRFQLAGRADGSTELGYDADGAVGGMIGGIGQRLLAGIAQRMAADFFGAVDSYLAGNVAALGQSASPDAAGAGPGTAGGAQETADGRPLLPPAAYVRAGGSGQTGFLRGVLAGTAATLAGVAIGSVLGRRKTDGR